MVMNRIMWRCILLTAVISFHGVSANLDDFNGSFTDRTLQAQRLLDLYAPIADNNILVLAALMLRSASAKSSSDLILFSANKSAILYASTA